SKAKTAAQKIAELFIAMADGSKFEVRILMLLNDSYAKGNTSHNEAMNELRSLLTAGNATLTETTKRLETGSSATADFDLTGPGDDIVERYKDYAPKPPTEEAEAFHDRRMSRWKAYLAVLQAAKLKSAQRKAAMDEWARTTTMEEVEA